MIDCPKCEGIGKTYSPRERPCSTCGGVGKCKILPATTHNPTNYLVNLASHIIGCDYANLTEFEQMTADMLSDLGFITYGETGIEPGSRLIAETDVPL